jgi:hypothetical protein
MASPASPRPSPKTKIGWDVANEMDIEDGVIWVYGVGIQAFTDFGIENLIELITSGCIRKIPDCSGAKGVACGPRRRNTHRSVGRRQKTRLR